MDKPEKIKIGYCPICGGTIKRMNLRKIARLNQVYGFKMALGGVNDTWGALIYNFSAELELSEEQTAKLSKIAEPYEQMMMGFLQERYVAGGLCRLHRGKVQRMHGPSERKVGLIWH